MRPYFKKGGMAQVADPELKTKNQTNKQTKNEIQNIIREYSRNLSSNKLEN
jgi:hypothetical protein